MPTTDLSKITSSLITLLTDGVEDIIGGTATITAQSPDKVPSSATNTLSFYLYHVREDPHYKNAEPVGGGQGPIARVPLALSLFYVATAHHHADSLPDPLQEQKLLSAALKILHDFPLIDDATMTPGGMPQLVLDESLRGNGNHFDVILRPVSPEDSASFWNGDDERVVRLSAFYEVRVVFLEPELPTQLPGYVLSLGNYVRPQSALYIDRTEGEVRFTVPGSSEKILKASPARAAIDLPLHNSLTLHGTGFSGGRLVLRSPLFVGAPQNQITIDPALNGPWSIKVTAGKITALVQDSVVDAQLGPVDILPGIYGVSVRLTTTYKLPGGLEKVVTTISNEEAIAFTPRILSNDPVSGDMPAVVALGTGLTDLTDPALDEAISVIVAGQVYALYTGGDPPGLREFKVTNTNEITIGAHFNSSNPGLYPVRLIIRGAESPPYWIEVPA